MKKSKPWHAKMRYLNNVSSFYVGEMKMESRLVDDQLQVNVRNLLKRMVKYKGDLYNNDREAYNSVGDSITELVAVNRMTDRWKETHFEDGGVIEYDSIAVSLALSKMKVVCDKMISSLDRKYAKQFETFKDEVDMLIVTLTLSDYKKGMGRW